MIKQTGLIVLIFLYCKISFAIDLIFSAPPLESKEVSYKVYQPVADFLSLVTEESVVYHFPKNWPTYIKKMQLGEYDFVLDAPHFVSWRIENTEHLPIASLADNLIYVIVVLEEAKIEVVENLKGKLVCSSALPNLDSLTLIDQFESTLEQPVIQVTQGYENKFKRLLSEQCDAAIFPKRVYSRLAIDEIRTTKIVFESQELPHYGLSMGPNISKHFLKELHTALQSNGAKRAFRGVAAINGVEGDANQILVYADTEVYLGYAYLLSDFWGF